MSAVRGGRALIMHGSGDVCPYARQWGCLSVRTAAPLWFGPGTGMDPWVSAAIGARACRRARVAICVTNLISRHPAVSAAAVASLDHLANGRAVLGIGAGHSGTKNVGLAKSRATSSPTA